MVVYSHLFEQSKNLRDCCYCSLHGCSLHGPLLCDADCCNPTARADFTRTTAIIAARVMAVGNLGAVALHRALEAGGSTLGRHLGGGLADRVA